MLSKDQVMFGVAVLVFEQVKLRITPTAFESVVVATVPPHIPEPETV